MNSKMYRRSTNAAQLRRANVQTFIAGVFQDNITKL